MEQLYNIATSFISIEERAQLVRFCAAMSGSVEVAEDLTQETLLEAWRHEQALRDPSRRSQWLMGIARNVYLRWQRKQGREAAHSYQRENVQQGQDERELEQLFVDGYDIELELERKELLELLDRALAQLPVQTRTVLIQHYIDDSPLAEVAQQLGTSANALAVRLQRGKLALRRLLTQDMQQEFADHYQMAEHASWETTPLWCVRCGQQHMQGRRFPGAGKLLLKCPACSPGTHQLLHRSELPLLKGMRSYKPMLTKLRQWSYDHYHAALAAHFAGESAPCEVCGQPLTVLFGPTEQLPERMQALLWEWRWSAEFNMVNTFCPRCQMMSNTSLAGLVLGLPEARAFVHAQSRIRTVPAQALETQGRAALLTRFESMSENVALNVISDQGTYEVLRIEQEGC